TRHDARPEARRSAPPSQRPDARRAARHAGRRRPRPRARRQLQRRDPLVVRHLAPVAASPALRGDGLAAARDPRPDRRGLLRPALRRGALRDPHERGAPRRDRDRPDAGPDPRPARRRGGPRGRRRAAPRRLAAVRGRPPARRRLVSSSVESARASAMTAFVSLDPFPLDGSVKTLGWGIVEWAESYLLQPDGDDAGEPYTFTRE